MLYKKSIEENVFDSLNIFIMALFTFIFIYPLLYCFFASISDPVLLSKHFGPIFRPLGLNFEAYGMVFGSNFVVRGLLNTAMYVTFGTFINILLTSFAAYVLSRKGYYWKRFFSMLVLVPMYFGGGLIPTYMVVNKIGLIDSPLAIILPSAINIFYLIIMMTYFQGLPESLEESAKLDGAHDFTILFKIILPVAKPIVAVMIVYYGVLQWNSWFNAMIYLVHDTKWQPLQLILRNMLLQNDVEKMTGKVNYLEGQQYARLIKYALIMVTIAPIVMIYPFMQKYFISGVLVGSLKE